MTQASVSTRSDDGHLRLVVAGEIDMSNADDVEAQIHSAIGNQDPLVVVDLTDVTYIDSTGVRVLVQLANQLDQINVTLRLIVPQESLPRRVVELTGLGAFATDAS